MKCRMSETWPLRTFKGHCSCGRKVTIRNDGKIPVHNKPKPKPCPSREATYVPWSWGEIYQCIECGERIRQDHNTVSARDPNGVRDYASIYPIPQHERKQS